MTNYSENLLKMAELVWTYEGKFSNRFYFEHRSSGLSVKDANGVYYTNDPTGIKLHPVSIILLFGGEKYENIPSDEYWSNYIERLFIPTNDTIDICGTKHKIEDYLFSPNDYSSFTKERIALRLVECAPHYEHLS